MPNGIGFDIDDTSEMYRVIKAFNGPFKTRPVTIKLYPIVVTQFNYIQALVL